MNPLNCPACGRFLSRSGSVGRSNGVEDWDLCWGICKVHGEQQWRQS